MTAYTKDFTTMGTTGPAGGTLINADTWTASGGRCVPTNTGNLSFLMEDFGQANGACQVTYIDGNSGDEGVVCRYLDDDNFIRAVAQSGTVYLQKCFAGSLGTMQAMSPGTVTTLRLEFTNASYRVICDGELLFEKLDEDGDFTSETIHGLVSYGTSNRMDDWVFDTVGIRPRLLDTQRWRSPGTFTATPPPEPAAPQVIGLAPAIIGVRTGQLTVGLSTADDPTAIKAELFRHPDYLHPVAALDTVSSPTVDGAFQKQWQDRKNEAGGGELTVPWQSELLDLIQPDDLVRFSCNGEAAMMIVLTDEDRRTVAATEADQSVTFSGPGHLGLMSEAVVYPSRGIEAEPVERDRVFNWTSPQFNDGSWGLVEDYGVYGDDALVNWEDGEGNPLPTEWAFATAHWVGPTAGSPLNAPPGFCFYRRNFTADTTDQYVIVFGCDNGGDLYIDSQLVATSVGWVNASVVTLTLSAGEHTLAMTTANEPVHLTNNPSGLIYAVAHFQGGILGATVAVSDGTEKIVEYPPYPPGMTPGEVLRIVLTEAQFRGELVGWTWTFDDDVDSNGVPWPETGDIGTKVGTDYLAFIGELVGAPWIDIRAQPGGLVVDAYNTGTMGEDSGVAYELPTDDRDPMSGNITELTHHRRSKTATRLLVGSKWPWRHIDVTPVDERVKTAVLGLGAVPSPFEADRIATGQLATYANVRSAITVGIEPAGLADAPYTGFRNGDTVEVPDYDLTPIDAVVESITVTEDDNGKVTFALEVNDVFIAAEERNQLALKKMTNGTMQGDTPAAKVATPINALDLGGPTCCPPQEAAPPG